MSASEYSALLKLTLVLYPPDNFYPFIPTSNYGDILSLSKPLYYNTSL